MVASSKVRQITVFLVDDHEMMRQGFKNILSRDRGVVVVGEASEGPEAISLIAELQPDIALLDIRLREGSGIDVVRGCQDLGLSTKLLIVSAYDDEHYVKSMVRLGVRGYLVKSASGRELRRAVRDIAEGHLVFPCGVADKVIDVLSIGERALRNRPQVALTERETEVMDRIAEGRTNREIADALGISSKTVESHVQRLLLKTGSATRTQAAANMLQDDLLA
jgi:two-component system, NarL family, response regulator DevR